jgi:putative multiple sugar transport system ATP-binding protein
MRGIGKSFPGVRALDGVSFAVAEAEIHALVGENGAGKSTLMKILSGVYPSGTFEGSILFEGEERSFRGIHDSERAGIIIIHQELALVPLLSIAENIFLGNEVARGGVIDWMEAYRRTQALLAQVGLKEAPTTLVGDIGTGKQQLVEIAKALSKRVKLLILDEPTASLNERDSEALLDLLLAFKRQGIASILISHKLNEVAKVADSITVLRDGTVVETIACSPQNPASEDRIIRGMVGRSLADRYPKREPAPPGPVILDVADWTVHHPLHPDRQVVKGVSFHVRAGEVVGIAGLMGAGRTELAMSLFGRAYGQKISGTVRLKGRKADLDTVQKAVAAGLAYVTEDRKTYGLVLEDHIKHNVTLANLKGVASGGVVDEMRELRVANDYKARLNIRAPSVFQKTVNLSGGNQQKVVLAKWLFAAPEVLILDEPTRGIDVGAKYEIYTIVNELAAAGKGLVVISSEMPELLGICDRIYVMNEGRFVAEMPIAEASQEAIMRAIVQNSRPSTAQTAPP